MSFVRKFLAAAMLAGSSLAASAYSDLFIFGDSLSDTGNVFLATGGAQPPAGQPYFNGRFSDGPVWVEHLAAGLGLPGAAKASFLGGHNFAFGGARMNDSNPVPGLIQQLGGLWAPAFPAADPNALYVLVGGGNDMRDARTSFQTNSAADAAGRQAAAQAAIGNLVNAMGFLATRGAKHVLVSNLPDLGQTPEAALLGLTAASSDATDRFNALMPALLGAGASFGLHMSFLDLDALLDDVRDDAVNNGGAVFGITNLSSPCAGFLGSSGASCNVSLFSDALHPSARAHALIGTAALAAAVPEPATLALVAGALLMLGAGARRRSAAG